MKLSKENKKILNDEFEFVIKKMENSENPDQMLYYFTGIYTMMQRILNLEFSEELLFTYFVVEKVYVAIMDRIRALKSGQTVVIFHEDFGAKLIDSVKDLKTNFNNSKQRIEILNKMVTLTYTTNGNGYYLTQKGLIDIYSDTKKLKDQTA
ncbi:MAG: hypothetical protein PF690_00755 [Deltaproteobacteria bacterium]|nr:hypothetical protein [Deltaproteobacteria bacterium]